MQLDVVVDVVGVDQFADRPVLLLYEAQNRLGQLVGQNVLGQARQQG